VIADEDVERVQEAADIVQVIGEFVRLKRVGRVYRGPCPFHQGTNNNFSVVPGRGYKCFVCGETGSVFTFVQKRFGFSFVEAVKYVASKSGIEIRETVRATGQPDPRERLWELVGAAATYFRDTLWNDESASMARAYLAERHITDEVAQRFELGFAPKPIGLLRSHLKLLGYDDARQLEAGILVVREEGEEPRPRFRGRLIFPIHDVSGHAVGFGGRSLDGSEPKYLNSPDNPVFSKGRLLYGLHRSRHNIRREDVVVIVEGYFDLIRPMAEGIENIVAPLGTALTEEQAALLARYTKNALLLYDSDQAGQKATFRAGDVLLRQGISPQAVSLPEGEDPDTFVLKHGADALRKLFEQAADVFELKLAHLRRADAFSDSHRRRRAIDKLLPTIRAAADPITRDIYLARASEVSGVSRATLERELNGTGRSGEAPPHDAPGAPPHGTAPIRPARPAPAVAPPDRGAVASRIRQAGFERDFLRALIARPTLLDLVASHIGPTSFREPLLGRIYGALAAWNVATGMDGLTGHVSGEAALALEILAADLDPLSLQDRTVTDGLKRFIDRDLGERMERLSKELDVATTDAERDALTKKKIALQKERQHLGAGSWSRLGRS
jgi:DNA primase